MHVVEIAQCREADLARDGATYGIGRVGDAPSAAFLHLAPEIGVGLSVVGRVRLTASLTGLLLIALSRPAWDAARLLYFPNDGAVTFPGESLAGSVVLGLAPGVSASYEF